MSNQEAVLFANDAFYAAFAERDIEAMARVWSQNNPISCTHPGWQTLEGHEEVMESWTAILSNPESPLIVCRARRAAIYGDMAIVTCVEEISTQSDEHEFLAATNVFVRSGRVWTMVHHQAGPVHVDPNVFEDDDEDQPQAIN